MTGKRVQMRMLHISHVRLPVEGTSASGGTHCPSGTGMLIGNRKLIYKPNKFHATQYTSTHTKNYNKMLYFYLDRGKHSGQTFRCC